MSRHEFWLVKLPGYVYEDWKSHANSPTAKHVGFMEAVTDMGQTKMSLRLDEAEEDAPTVMPVKKTNHPGYPVFMFKETGGMKRKFDYSGEVQAFATANPTLSSDYVRFVKSRSQGKLDVEESRKVYLDEHDDVQEMDMLQKTSLRTQMRREKKATLEKRVRADETEVLAMLRKLFSVTPYMTLNELQEATQQPKMHLAGILKVWCIRHVSGEFANKYSLKDINTVQR